MYVLDKSVALGTTTVLIVNLFLVSATRKELKFWWRAHRGHYCFSKQTVTESWNFISNPITALTIGRGCDSLPRNGRPSIGSVLTLKEAYSMELLLILGLVLCVTLTSLAVRAGTQLTLCHTAILRTYLHNFIYLCYLFT